VIEFHLKVLLAYEGRKNKTKVKMGMAGLERCFTNGKESRRRSLIAS
jgi:hypothetical protein